MASFRNVYNSLILLIAGATQKELARQVSYLKAENQILRNRLPDRLSLTEREKNRLCRFAKNLGKALNELASIVHPDTIRRWIRESKSKGGRTAGKPGRKRTQADIEKLVLKLAKDNGWGYTRILGELKKLEIESITRNTVKNILRRGGFETGPNRGTGTWDEFLKIHAKTLWQCDFFSKKVLTPTGLKDLYLLIFLHVETRRAYISPSTYHPNEAWVVDQAEAFHDHAKSAGLKAKIVMHDRDTKFTASFDEALKSRGSKTRTSSFRAPNQNAFVERFIQTLQQECLDHFVVFGQAHMDHLCEQFAAHYHEERPHQGLENAIPTAKKARSRTEGKSTSPETIRLSDIHCKERLGGLLKHYSRAA